MLRFDTIQGVAISSTIDFLLIKRPWYSNTKYINIYHKKYVLKA